MKIKISKKTILKPIQQCVGILEKRQTIPILSNILVKSSNGNLIFTATDLEILISSICEADIEGSGEFIIPGKKFFDICKCLPDESMIELQPKETKVIIKSGKSRYTLSTLPAIDYPTIKQLNIEDEFIIKQKHLKKIFENTLNCVAVQDVRFYLNGLLLEVRNDNIRCVSSDGHRLAMCQYKSESPLEQEIKKDAIIPRKAILELQRILEENDDTVTCYFDANHFRLENEEFIFTTKLIDSEYPNYEKILLLTGERELILDKLEFKNALSRATILANEKNKNIDLIFEDNNLKIKANNPEQEEAEENLDIDYNFDPIEISFNGQYLIEAINLVKSENLKVTIADVTKGFLIEDLDDVNTKFVVMPLLN